MKVACVSASDVWMGFDMSVLNNGELLSAPASLFLPITLFRATYVTVGLSLETQDELIASFKRGPIENERHEL